MDIYKLNEEQLKKYEKEFYETAYGKRLKNAKNSAIASMVIFLVIMVLKSVFGGDGITEAITDGILWIGILISDFAEALIIFNCNKEIKEYIKNNKQ